MSGGWYETVESQEVYRGRSIVRLDRVRMPDGEPAEREVVEHDDAVAVVPVTAAGDVVLLRQYRHPIRRYILEIPAGTLDEDGETVEEAARRELAEEIQHEAGRLTRLVTFQNSAGWSDEHTTVFLAEDLRPVGHPDGFVLEGEEADMEVLTMSLQDAAAAARAGEITDAKTVIGVLLAADRISSAS